jgi:hypothetical protein
MKIKFLSGPRAGQTEHVPNSQQYQVMVSAGLIEIVEMPAAHSAGWLAERIEQSRAAEPKLAPVKVLWSVVKGAITDRWAIRAKCSRPNCSDFFFDGDPGKIAAQQSSELLNGLKVTHKHVTVENQQFIHSCSGTAPEKVPAGICAEYRAKKKAETSIGMGADEANYYQNCQKSKGDGEKMPINNGRLKVGDFI